MGEEGKQLFDSMAFDLIILDVNLPDMSGLELAEYTHGKNAKLPILTLTALDTTPGIAYGDAFYTFNEAIFRSVEAYLIAAEAIVKGAKGGKLGGTEVYYNKVLDRALVKKGTDPQCAKSPENVKSLEAVSYRAISTNIPIDLILDERARELMGEYSRWFDLKRTGKLVERVKNTTPGPAKVPL